MLVPHVISIGEISINCPLETVDVINVVVGAAICVEVDNGGRDLVELAVAISVCVDTGSLV